MITKRFLSGPSALVAVLLAGALSFVAVGCEDPVPTDYVQEYVFTGYLIVDEPIRNIRLTRSLAPLDSFDYRKAEIADAAVTIWTEDDTFQLAFQPKDTGVGHYYYPDAGVTVQPNTLYRMEARLADGTVLRSATLTPGRVEWTQAPKEVLQYPLDTLALQAPDSLDLIWTRVEGVDEYLISVIALDTLEYGRYLNPPTDEMNRRIYRFYEQDAPRYNEITRWGFLQSTRSPTFWPAFKWFGKQEITLYAPDDHLLEWFKQNRFNGGRYSELLGSIEGGIGVFGSASVARDTVFVLKNQQ